MENQSSSFTPAVRASAIELNARASSNFATKLAETQALLQQAATDYAPVTNGGLALVTQASSLGAEDMVVSHLINALALNIPIFVLETGMLHAETLQVLEDLKASSRAHVNVYKPLSEHVVQFVTREGKDAMYKSIDLRKACCGIRKMEPLERALAGKKAWITGIRREQGPTRADTELIERDDTRRLWKYNPLAHWTDKDLWRRINERELPYNSLHDQGYESIGCAPCTQPGSGREGRWAGTEKTECGLHIEIVE